MKTHLHIIHAKTYPRQAHPCRLQGLERSFSSVGRFFCLPLDWESFSIFFLKYQTGPGKALRRFFSWWFFQYVAPALNSKCHRKNPPELTLFYFHLLEIARAKSEPTDSSFSTLNLLLRTWKRQDFQRLKVALHHLPSKIEVRGCRWDQPLIYEAKITFDKWSIFVTRITCLQENSTRTCHTLEN